MTSITDLQVDLLLNHTNSKTSTESASESCLYGEITPHFQGDVMRISRPHDVQLPYG